MADRLNTWLPKESRNNQLVYNKSAVWN